MLAWRIFAPSFENQAWCAKSKTTEIMAPRVAHVMQIIIELTQYLR